MPSFQKSLLLIFFGLLSSLSLSAQSIELRLQFIDKYKLLAVQEQERASIPASITLAQAIFETGWGRSTICQQAKNFFGIKCGGARWKGDTFYREDDDRDGNGILIKSCFRSYKSAEESFIDRSAFLRENPRYGKLFTNYALTDYRGWAYGLVQAGYATKVSYGDDLISVIERNNLQRFDKMRVVDILAEIGGGNTIPTNPTSPPIEGEKPTTVKPRRDDFADVNGVFRRNDVKAILIVNHPTLEQVAGRYEVSVSKLLSYNEKIGSPIQPLKDSMIIYLQRKRAFTLDREFKEHYVKPNETMYEIAQLYGIRLAKLLAKNKMQDGEEPAFGQKIVLRKGWFQVVEKPKTRDIRFDKPLVTNNSNNYPNVPNINNEPNRGNQEPPIIPTPKPTEPTKTNNSNGEELEMEISPGEITAPNNGSPTNGSTPPVQGGGNGSPTVSNPVEEPKYEPMPTVIPTYYTVKQGDSLYGISRQYGITIQEIQRLNNLGTSTTIRPNQRLRIR